MTKPPLVSVLMPFHDARPWLAQAIESVFAQTHRNLELIAIDDASRDEGIVVARDLWRRSPIPMRLLRQQQAGPSGTLHRALELASGEWVCWLAADDWYAPEFIQRNLETAAGLGPGDWVLHCNSFLAEADGRITGTADSISTQAPLRGDAFELWLSGQGRMAPSTMFVRRELLLRAGGFDPSFFAEDHDLFLRLTRAARFHYIEEPLFYSRVTQGSLGTKTWVWAEDVVRAIRKHEDRLGDRLPGIISKASENLAVACLENGGPGHAWTWARRAVREAPGTGSKLRIAARISARGARAVARSSAIRLFGRDRLVRAKRRLFPAQRSSDGARAATESLSSERAPRPTNESPK
jgi:alpha-1,3-rhamnosyltransferase